MGSGWQILKRSRRSTIGQPPLFSRLCFLRLAQAAIALQDVGDVLGNLVAGAVAADDDVAHGRNRGEIGDATLASIAELPSLAYLLGATNEPSNNGLDHIT